MATAIGNSARNLQLVLDTDTVYPPPLPSFCTRTQTTVFKIRIQILLASCQKFDWPCIQFDADKLWVVILGNWMENGQWPAVNLNSVIFKDDEPVQLQASPGSGKVDYIDFDSPTELLQALLRQLGGSAQIDKLCKVS